MTGQPPPQAMSDNDLGALETELADTLDLIAELHAEAAVLTRRIAAEYKRRQVPGTLHQLHR
jgi:hypothetical protein